MVENVALGTRTARTRTGIATFQIDARQGTATFRTDGTFWTTRRWGAGVIRQTRTRG